MSERVGTVEVEHQLINFLNEKTKKVFHLGVGNYFKNKTHTITIYYLNNL